MLLATAGHTPKLRVENKALPQPVGAVRLQTEGADSCGEEPEPLTRAPHVGESGGSLYGKSHARGGDCRVGLDNPIANTGAPRTREKLAWCSRRRDGR